MTLQVCAQQRIQSLILGYKRHQCSTERLKRVGGAQQWQKNSFELNTCLQIRWRVESQSVTRLTESRVCAATAERGNVSGRDAQKSPSSCLTAESDLPSFHRFHIVVIVVHCCLTTFSTVSAVSLLFHLTNTARFSCGKTVPRCCIANKSKASQMVCCRCKTLLQRRLCLLLSGKRLCPTNRVCDSRHLLQSLLPVCLCGHQRLLAVLVKLTASLNLFLFFRHFSRLPPPICVAVLVNHQ